MPVSSSLSDIDKIDDLMQDITEQQDRAQEISEAISRPYGDVYDEVNIVPTSLSLFSTEL